MLLVTSNSEPETKQICTYLCAEPTMALKTFCVMIIRFFLFSSMFSPVSSLQRKEHNKMLVWNMEFLLGSSRVTRSRLRSHGGHTWNTLAISPKVALGVIVWKSSSTVWKNRDCNFLYILATQFMRKHKLHTVFCVFVFRKGRATFWLNEVVVVTSSESA